MSEHMFLTLLKRCAALEPIANEQLMPRDHLLGITIPEYDTHVLEQFDVLDATGQRDVLRSRATVPLDERIRSAPHTQDLHDIEPAEAEAVLGAHPWLVHYVRLYQANAALDATHWAMIVKYMIKPMRQRDFDAIVVSNHAGTTHMWMDTLKASWRPAPTIPWSA